MAAVLRLAVLAGSAQNDPVRVDLGAASVAIQGEEENLVVLPLTISAPTGVRIVKLETTISFPSESLSFTRVASQPEGVKVEARASADPENGEQSRLLIVASPTDSARPLPPGVIAELEFQVSPYAPTGTLELPHEPRADSASQPLQNVQGSPGSIEIGTPPISVCFFYMH